MYALRIARAVHRCIQKSSESGLLFRGRHARSTFRSRRRDLNGGLTIAEHEYVLASFLDLSNEFREFPARFAYHDLLHVLLG